MRYLINQLPVIRYIKIMFSIDSPPLCLRNKALTSCQPRNRRASPLYNSDQVSKEIYGLIPYFYWHYNGKQMVIYIIVKMCNLSPSEK